MFSSLAASAGILGLFIALPLLLGGRKRPATFWLGMFVFSVCWLSLAYLYNIYPQYLFGVFDWPLAGLGAFYYCYLRQMIGLGNSRRQLWHFVPLALWSGGLLLARLLVPPQTLLAWWTGPTGYFNELLLVFQLLALGYAPAALVRLWHFRAQLRQNYSSVRYRDLKWLTSSTLVLAAILLLWIPATQLGGLVAQTIFSVARLLILFYLGWYGMHQFPVQMPDLSPPPPAPEAVGGGEKYARSGMNDAAEKLIGQRLALRAERERDYLEPDIKLTDLAERIGTSPQLLSQYLNDMLGMNFFDYINGLRVAQVQRQLADPAQDSASLLEIAFAAGFSSKSTFNASFKKITGLAPSAWRKLQRKTSGPIG
jgi:AraC-like DNA-binding protein